jgi:lipopolysaccharide export system permease protein
MRLLDRYLLRTFAITAAYCLILFFMLFVIVDIFNDLDEILKQGASLKIIISYYFYLMPAIIVQIVPIATLVSLLYVLSNFNRHNEIVALKASGISSLQILSPYLFMGLLISFSVFLLNEKAVPQATITSTAIREGLIEKGKKTFAERSINNVTVFGAGNRMIYAREYEILARTLHDVVILYEGPSQTLKSKMTAKKAIFEDDHWVFRDAMKYQLSRTGDIVGEPIFSKELQLDIEEKPEDFIREASQVEFMSARQLKAYIDKFKGGSKKLVRRLSVDMHYKIAFPFISFVVMLIGAPLAMRTERGRGMVGIGTSLGIVLLYYAVHSICLALGKGGLLSPFLAAWLANILFAAIGIYLIKEAA